jgi:hypothetical protein
VEKHITYTKCIIAYLVFVVRRYEAETRLRAAPL